MENQTTPETFKAMIVSKYPDGVSSDGTPYAKMDALKLTQSVVSKYPDGMTNAGIPYKNYLQEPSSTGMSVGPLAPASDTDSAVGAGIRTALNVVPSALNVIPSTVKGVAQGYKDLGAIPQAVKDLSDATGGQIMPGGSIEDPYNAALKAKIDEGKAAGRDMSHEETVYSNILKTPAPHNQGIIGNFLGELLPTAYDTLVPSAVQKLIRGDTNGARKDIENDPVGQILPFLVIGREAAFKASPEAGAAFDHAVTQTAKPVITAAKPVMTGIGSVLSVPGKVGKFSVGQATGLNPSTIDTITENPKAFKGGGSLDRPTVAAEVKSALDTREEALSETGQGYNGVRNATGKVPAMINVEPSFLKNVIEKATGTTVDANSNSLKADTGEVKTSGSAKIRDPKDVRALQSFYNTWQPIFEQGQMTPNEFLNMRSDLAKLSKFDREISKSGDLENAAKEMRANLNNEYRTQIHGLEDTDATYSSQVSELQDLRKGILDKNGELTDAAINKIANSTNKGRSVFLSKLEEIAPGITKKVKVLKAIEDIENAHGQKVGTYVRALGVGGAGAALLSGNIPALAGIIATTILASPDVAVPLMRAYGSVKGLTGAVVDQLKTGVSKINQLPQGAPALFPRKR